MDVKNGRARSSKDAHDEVKFLDGANAAQRRLARNKHRMACKWDGIAPTPSASGIAPAAIEQQRPEASFGVGQSVMWFWASWFSTGDVWPHSGTREP